MGPWPPSEPQCPHVERRGRSKRSPGSAPTMCQSRESLPPRHGSQQAPQRRRGGRPTLGWGPSLLLEAWQLRRAGVAHRNSLNTFSNRTGNWRGARRQLAGWVISLGVGRTNRRGRGTPIFQSLQPRGQREPTPEPDAGYSPGHSLESQSKLEVGAPGGGPWVGGRGERPARPWPAPSPLLPVLA